MVFLSNLDVIIGICGFLYGIFTFFYYKKIKFYMFISRIFKFNKTIEINMSYQFVAMEDIKLNDLKGILKDEKYKIMNANNNNIILNMNDFIIQFKKDDFPPEEYNNNAVISMAITKTYYKQAKQSIDRFINLCENYQEKKLSNKGLYNLTINYSNVKNPYLSASAHRIDEENIKNLIIKVDTSFLVNDLNENVIINKDKLSYTSKSSKNIYKIAREFMII
ncbi:MAG: hypothetical protein ACTIJD_11735 [Staphylococcus saprophyticus]|nr:hypothetical protein [Staphylococcus saprophyticus]